MVSPWRHDAGKEREREEKGGTRSLLSDREEGVMYDAINCLCLLENLICIWLKILQEKLACILFLFAPIINGDH